MKMMMMSSSSVGRSSSGGGSCTRYPFTSIQWQELEHQALVYKYMVSGIPIPPDLLFSIRRSFDSSSKFLLHHHHQSPMHHIGWSGGGGSGCYGQYHHHQQMGYGMMRKIDPEPGRCRRTDGKKWRCSKEAYLDSKYCERHMHRGRNRSRKPVEIISTAPPTILTNGSTSTTTATSSSTHCSFPMNKSSNTHPCTTNTINNSTSSNISFLSSSSSAAPAHESHHFLYPQVPLQHISSSSRHQESNTTTNFFLDSSNVNPHSRRDYYSTRNMFGQGFKEEETSCNEHHGFLSEVNCKSVSDYSRWKLAPGVTTTMGYMANNNSNLNIEIRNRDDDNGGGDDQYNQNQPKKVMHHFLDEWPHRDSTEDNTLSSSTHLSVSAPNPLHDFFITNKW